MTAGWTYEFSPSAQRDLRRFDSRTRQRIVDALDRLVDDPPHGDFRKLQGATDLWRLRVGDIRVRLRRRSDVRTLVVVGVQPRDRAYRD